MATYKPHELDPHIFGLLADGEMHSKDIYASMPKKERVLKRRLGILKRHNKVLARNRFYYRLPTDTSSDSTKARPDEKLKQISKQLRTAEDNEVTISELLNAYDVVQRDFISNLTDNIGDGTDLQQRAFFLDTLKLLTLVVDKLMKRWSLVHVGYDTNTRQAQEDAKAKTEEREKEALKDAPLEDTIIVVGHYKEGFEKILEHLPKKEADKIKV